MSDYFFCLEWLVIDGCLNILAEPDVIRTLDNIRDQDNQ